MKQEEQTVERPKTKQAFERHPDFVKTGVQEYSYARAIACGFYVKLTGEASPPENGLDSADGRFRVRVKRRQNDGRESFDVIGYRRISKKNVEHGKKSG